MKNLLRILLTLVATATAAFAQTGTAIPGGNQSTTYVISKPGRYYLAAHRVMTNPNLNAIEIASDDVTLDLNGHTVAFASNVGTGCGVYGIDIENTEIRNGGVVFTPSEGVSIMSSPGYSSGNTRIIDLRVSQTGGYSISVTGNAVIVSKCTVNETAKTGIWVDAPSTLISECAVTGAGWEGIYAKSPGSLVRNCVVSQTQKTGIESFVNGTVENCSVTDANLGQSAGDAGIRADGYAVVRGNTVTSCRKVGILVTTGGLVEGNAIRGNSGYAIFSSSNGALMVNNRYTKILQIGGITNGGGNIAY